MKTKNIFDIQKSSHYGLVIFDSSKISILTSELYIIDFEKLVTFSGPYLRASQNDDRIVIYIIYYKV